MDEVEKWLCDQAETMVSSAAKATAYLLASRWHDVGELVLAERFARTDDATDWQGFAADLLSGDREKIKARMPGWLRDAMNQAEAREAAAGKVKP